MYLVSNALLSVYFSKPGVTSPLTRCHIRTNSWATLKHNCAKKIPL